MAIDKTRLRRDIIHDFGVQFEDMLEQARKEIARNEGAKVALKTAKAKVEALCTHVEKDLEEGVLENLISGDDAGVLPLASYIKRKIMQAGGVIENLNGIVAVNAMRAEGELTAYKAVFAAVKKSHDAAVAKEEFLAKVASGELDEGVARPEGVHPSDVPLSPAADIAQRREQARKEKEEAAEADSEKEKEEVAEADETPVEQTGIPAFKPRRSRKKKKKGDAQDAG